jgi:sigma-E factor negative regulatory protein RseB
MDSRAPQTGTGLSPGTDPVALRLVTAAVLAGLVMTGFAVAAWNGHALTRRAAPSPASARPSIAGLAGTVRLAGPAPIPGPVPAARQGERLLTQAALACRQVTYQGVEVLKWWGPDGPTTSVMDVWHARGGETLTRAVTAAPAGQVRARNATVPGDSGGGTLYGGAMLGMSQQLVNLLGTNYRLASAGWGQVAGRRARVVAVRRPSGGMAAKFWLDAATTLPLRRQVFDTRGRLVSDGEFTGLRVGRAAAAGAPVPAARPWSDTLAVTQLNQLRAHGWPLPGPLPAKLALLGASENKTAAGPIVDLDYSDGLSVISVFVQRGHLPPRMSGWSEVALKGHAVYADHSDEYSFAWSARGFVYTVVAAAPAQTVVAVVVALPHDDSPGFMARMRRGLHRFLTWMSP